MSTITTIQSTDVITNSRSVINTNFTNLNTDKVETSAIDTDTALSANSDAKIPSQKAVKAYVDAGGNVNASTTQKGIAEEATQSEVDAGTASGGSGARLFVNPSTLSGFLTASGAFTKVGTGATTYDLSTASGSQTIAHGLSTTPRFVLLRADYTDGATNTSVSKMSYAIAVYSASTWVYSHVHMQSGSGATASASASGNTFKIFEQKSSERSQSATLAVDGTNITLTWTKTSTPTGTAYITWEAFA